MANVEETAQKEFDEQDKRWGGPKFIIVGIVTLTIALSLIFLMSRTTGCSLQIVP